MHMDRDEYLELDDFTQAYIECALWSSNDESDPETGGDPIDENYGPEDLDDECLAKMKADCAKFLRENAATISKAECNRGSGQYSKEAQAGHDFWLTRNGHGCGFWDGDWSEPEATMLDNASKDFGETWITVQDDKIITL
jgi:hypothetical protein